MTELLDLGDILQTPVRNLSLGQRMRCEIVASLLHDPKVLFLDEPTIGLDAVSKIAVRKFIRRLNVERGTTILLTTHDMQDIEALTQRVLLIGKGKVLVDGTLAGLKKHIASRKTMTIEYRGPLPTPIEGMMPLQSDDGRLVLSFDPSEIPVSEAITYFAQNTDLLDVSVSDVTTEEMAAKLYKEYNL